MKKIILITVFFSFISCGKSIYYAYEDIGKNYSGESYIKSYCTIEVTRKKEVIYRATSSNYWMNDYKKSNKFVYLYSYNDDDFPNIDNESFSFSNILLEMYYIKNHPPNYRIGFVKNIYPSKVYIDFIKKGKDSLKSEYYLNDLPKENSFEEAGINWFPPYMVKIDKIDYLKFPKEIQHMNLKNPLESVNYLDDPYYSKSDAYIYRNKKGKYGFSNNNFKTIIKPKFDGAHSSVDDYYPVKKGEKWGVINSNGKIIIRFIYSYINVLKNDDNFIGFVASETENGLYALLSMKNELLTQFKYSDISTYSGSLFKIKKDGKYGIINSQGKEIIEPLYGYNISKIERYDLLIAEKESKSYIFDLNGNIKFECDDFTIDNLGIPVFTKNNIKYILKDDGLNFIEKKI
jgi:hypothetical protein